MISIGVLISACVFLQAGQNASGPIVRTASGLVQGMDEGDTSTFKGIPFASPPVGELRWRPPQPAVPWSGVRDATKYGSDCAQGGFGRQGGTGISPNSSEDCLFLNIWKPSRAKAGAKLPVMVWIHGGGFVGGSGAGATTAGTQFAKRGIVLVTINYRLGRLGFFAFPALSKERPGELKSSYGYMDQIAALGWVQKNIAAFGGDPKNVTIFGESAGGVSVHTHLTSPLSRGLFHKAISESGGGRDGVLTGRPMAEAEAIGVNFARKHGIEGTDASALARLRSLSVAEIVDGGQESAGGVPIYAGPIEDGRLVVETPQSAYEHGRGAKVPLIIGSNSSDFVGFISADSKDALFDQFGAAKAQAMAAYDPNGNAELRSLLTMAGTDRVQAEPARFTANAFARKGARAYVYRFGYLPASLRERMAEGVPHGAEIPYVFDTLGAGWGPPPTDQDRAVARMVNAYWANFAKTGDPNGPGLPKWIQHNPKKDAVMEFRPEGSAVSGPDPRKARLDATETAAPRSKPPKH